MLPKIFWEQSTGKTTINDTALAPVKTFIEARLEKQTALFTWMERPTFSASINPAFRNGRKQHDSYERP
jgi:hypothetical protein